MGLYFLYKLISLGFDSIPCMIWGFMKTLRVLLKNIHKINK